MLAGGLFATALQLTGALVDRHGPERQAVARAADAVADFVDAVGGPDADELQHEAAVSMPPSATRPSASGPSWRPASAWPTGCWRRRTGWRTRVPAAGTSRAGPGCSRPGRRRAAGLRCRAATIRHGGPAAGLGEVPSFVSRDVGDLRRVLVE